MKNISRLLLCILTLPLIFQQPVLARLQEPAVQKSYLAPASSFEPDQPEPPEPAYPGLIDGAEVQPAFARAFNASLKIVHYLRESKTEAVVISGAEALLVTGFLQAAWVRLFGDAKFPIIYWIRPDIEERLLQLSTDERDKALEGLEWLRNRKSLYLELTDACERKTEKFRKSFERLGFNNLDFGFLLASRDALNQPGGPYVVATYADEKPVRTLALIASMLRYVEFDDPEEVDFHIDFLAEMIPAHFSDAQIPPNLVPDSISEQHPGALDLSVAPVEEQQEALPAIVAQRGYKLIQNYGRGGSSCRTYLAENSSGRRVVIKYADWEGISGNGTPWLVRQVEKLKTIESSFPPEASALYPRVLDFYHEGSVAFYAMEYFERAMDITKYYFYDPFVNEAQMYRSVDGFVTLMATSHYRHGLERYPDELKANVLARMRYRTGLLPKHKGDIYDHLVRGHPFSVGSLRYADASYFFESLMKAKYVAINGRVYPNLPVLLEILEKNADVLQKALGPSHYTPFSHGDLPLRNVLKLPDGTVRIIDVRGQNIHETSPSKTSVEYDLAKIAHGFVLELVRNGFYQLNAAQKGSNFEFNYNFFNYPGNERYQFMRKHIYALLAGNTALQSVLASPDSRWLAHVKLGEVANYASDAIHRFSQDPTGEHPLLYYLMATEGLYEFLKPLGLLPDDLVKKAEQPAAAMSPPLAFGAEAIDADLAEILTSMPGLVRFAVNGASNSGKTFFAEELSKRISFAGRPTAVVSARPADATSQVQYKSLDQPFISLDWFLIDRDARSLIIEKVGNGEIPLSKYQSLAWDMRGYEIMLRAIDAHVRKNDGSTFRYYIPHAYNRETGLRDLDVRIEIPPNAIAVFEGVGSVDSMRERYFDCSLLVDNKDEEAVVQAEIEREKKKPPAKRLAEHVLRKRLEAVDIPRAPYFRYFMIDAHDFYIDNTDHKRPVLYTVSRNSDFGKVGTEHLAAEDRGGMELAKSM